MAYVPGKALVTTWTPSGGSSYTIPVLDDNGDDGGDVLDATNTTHAGEQAVMAGIHRVTKNVKFLLDTAAPLFTATRNIKFGAKGTLSTEFSSGNAESLPCMISRVGRSRACNGLVTIDVTVVSDAITGSMTYPSA